jgi:SPP1 gp7 family putative phage head morphogenesis protein
MPSRHSRAEINAFSRIRKAEESYARQLRQVARAVGHFVRGLFPNGEPAHADALTQLQAGLAGYAETITPWAEAVANRMLADVAQRDERAWAKLGDTMVRALHREVTQTPLGSIVRQRLADQVFLIKSLPLEAAQRVQALTVRQYLEGGRSTEIIDEILASGEVAATRATLIARTETGRTAFEFTRARAERVGSEGYTWMAVNDRDTRPRHLQLHGTFHRWNDPPVASERGQKVMKYHAGSGPNCRCWPSPLVADYIA